MNFVDGFVTKSKGRMDFAAFRVEVVALLLPLLLLAVLLKELRAWADLDLLVVLQMLRVVAPLLVALAERSRFLAIWIASDDRVVLRFDGFCDEDFLATEVTSLLLALLLNILVKHYQSSFSSASLLTLLKESVELCFVRSNVELTLIMRGRLRFFSCPN